MEIAKALILAGSGAYGASWTMMAGTRHLFPVGNRPILFHNLEALRAAGVLEAAILADADVAASLRVAVGDGCRWGMNIVYADWHWSAGLPGALAAMQGFVTDEPVLVEQADALLHEQIHGHITKFARERLDALALRLTQPSPGLPTELTPGYLLSSRAVSILREDGVDVTEPIAGIRARGGRVEVAHVRGCLPCHGDVDALLDSNRCVLEGLVSDYSADSLDGSATSVQGNVHIHPTAQIRRSVLRGPLVIGPGVHVSDAYIGPYTSIGANVVIEAAEIEHSIVLSNAELRFIGTRLESSVIGRGARVVRGFEVPAAIRMALGDGAEVFLR